MPLTSLDVRRANHTDEDEVGADIGPLRLRTVRCVTLEEVLDQLGLQRVSFLSVDVAGAELSVLESIDYSKVRRAWCISSALSFCISIRG